MNKIHVNKDIFQILIAFLFSLVFVLIPWENVLIYATGENFLDRQVYEQYFYSGKNSISIDYFSSIIDYITNEAGWHYGVRWFLDDVGLSVDQLFLVISFLTIFTYSLLLQKWRGIYSLLFLINPLIVDFAFSQVRLALAASMLACAYLSRSRWPKFALAVAFLSITVHTAALLFLLIYCAAWLAGVALERGRLSEIQILAFLVAVGFLVAFITGPARDLILSYAGDRRAEYWDMTWTFKTMLFWFGLFGAFLFFGRKILWQDYGRYALIILSLLFWIYFLGGYSSRFAAFAFPCLIAGALGLKQPWRILIAIVFIVNTGIMWLYWLKIY